MQLFTESFRSFKWTAPQPQLVDTATTTDDSADQYYFEKSYVSTPYNDCYSLKLSHNQHHTISRPSGWNKFN
jgi:hypothetical protein